VSGVAGQVADFARSLPENVGNTAQAAKDFMDYRVTGAGYDRVNPDNPEIQEAFKNISESTPSQLSVDPRMTGFSMDSRMVYSPEEAMQYMQEAADIGRNNSLFGRVGNLAGQAAQNVGNAVSGAAGNAVDWARNAAGNVGNWAGQAAQNVGSFVSEMTNPHYQLNAQQLTDNYRQYLNEHPENPQSPQHADWLREQVKNDPQLRAYYEQNIREQTIPEQTIPEQRIPEKTTRELNPGQQKQVDYWSGIIQNRLDNFDDYYNNLVAMPQFKNYTRQDVMNDLLEQQDYWQNRAYREDMFHSALNDKPDGVSDAFWEKFTADGGTQEEYERDWR